MKDNNRNPDMGITATETKSDSAACSVPPSFCLSGYSEVYLPDLTPDVGVRSFKGVGNLEITGKRMVCHEGQVWDIELTNGSFYSCQEGVGGTFYDSMNLVHGSGSHDKYVLPNAEATRRDENIETR